MASITKKLSFCFYLINSNLSGHMWLSAAIKDGQIYSVIILLSTYTILLVAQMIKNLPAIQEMWVQSLIWEDPPEKGMSTHSSILAWRIP